MISSITTVIAVAIPNSTGREKKIVKSCTEALAVAGGLARAMLAEAGRAVPPPRG